MTPLISCQNKTTNYGIATLIELRNYFVQRKPIFVGANTESRILEKSIFNKTNNSLN